MANQSDHSGAQAPDAKGLPPHNNKRKRDSLDRESTASRPGPGDSGRPSGYRVSSATNNKSSTGGSSTGAADMSDQAAASFLTAHNTSGTSDDDIHHSTNSSLDFAAALSQQNAGEHGLQTNGGGAHTNAASDTAAAALSHFTMNVPQATEISFQTQSSNGDGDRPLTASFGIGEHGTPSHGLSDFTLDSLKTGSPVAAKDSPSGAGQKPAVGSEEWHKVRRDNHKEVERRRRETINEGINELAKIVPGCEKNKGSILQRAVQFITQLKENEAQNIEKWTLEKLLTEQAISELSASCDKLKADCQRAWSEASMWKKAALAAGVSADDVHPSEEEGTAGENGA